MTTSSLKLLSFVLIITIFDCALANENVDFYQKYYIEDSCTDDENITYVLSKDIYSVARIEAFRSGGLHYGVRHCTVIIKPPTGYSVYLHIEKFRYGFLHDNSLECASYIQISGNGTVSEKLCGLPSGLPSTSFATYGNMTILFHMGNDYLLAGIGFTLVVTAYKMPPCTGYDSFLCENRRCIWQGLKCDSVDNCGDSSDEMAFGTSQCYDIDRFTMKPIDFNWEMTYPTPEIVTFRSSHNISLGAAITSTLFVLLGAFIRFYCYYQCNQQRRRQVLNAVTIIRARSVLRQPSINNAPPPYETLVNDPESPPEYTAVTIPPTVPCDPQNAAAAATASCPPADKNANISCGPPPPYEP